MNIERLFSQSSLNSVVKLEMKVIAKCTLLLVGIDQQG